MYNNIETVEFLKKYGVSYVIPLVSENFDRIKGFALDSGSEFVYVGFSKRRKVFDNGDSILVSKTFLEWFAEDSGQTLLILLKSDCAIFPYRIDLAVMDANPLREEYHKWTKYMKRKGRRNGFTFRK